MYSVLEFSSGLYLPDQSIQLFIDPSKELKDIFKVGLPFTDAMMTFPCHVDSSQASHIYTCVHYILLICPYKHLRCISGVHWILAKVFWKTCVTFDPPNVGKAGRYKAHTSDPWSSCSENILSLQHIEMVRAHPNCSVQAQETLIAMIAFALYMKIGKQTSKTLNSLL